MDRTDKIVLYIILIAVIGLIVSHVFLIKTMKEEIDRALTQLQLIADNFSIW